MKFIDEANISVQAGHGGRGSISFRREKYVPRGGPDGGDGGKGGDVVFEATTRMSTLLDFKYQRRFEAKNGSPGMGKMKNGKAAPDLVIPVPVGTVITDRSSNDVLADMTTDKQRVIIAKSGRGGKGNTFFTTSTRQAPKFSQDGEEGESKEIHLELKLLADVGLIGEPNAGKSTLLNTLTQSNIIAANRLFATLDPSSRRLRFPKDVEVIITDTVGFIQNLPRNLMEAFHATLDELIDADVILHVIDISNPRYKQQKETVEQILKDLKLDTIPTLFVFNKIDRIALDSFDDQWFLTQGIPISATRKETLKPLIDKLESMITLTK